MKRALLLLACIVGIACSPRPNAVMLPGPTPPAWGSEAWFSFVRHLRDSLVAADPTLEASAAAQRGDFHVLGVRGYDLSVPGLGNKWPKYKAGVYILPATSDAIEGWEHLSYIQVARQYAERYNATILSRLQRTSQ